MLGNTIVMYTSDNGFLLGQHGVSTDKHQLYQHDIQGPFFARGPMLESGMTNGQTVHYIDIAPMIVEFATDEQKDLYTLWNSSSQ